MAPIEENRVAGEQAAHEGGERLRGGHQQEVKVVLHQGPGETRGRCFPEKGREPQKKKDGMASIIKLLN